MSELTAQDLGRIRDAANLLQEEGLDDDLVADLDLIGDRIADELKLNLDTHVRFVEIEVDELAELRQVESYLRGVALGIAVGKRGFMGAGEVGYQAGRLQKVLDKVAERLDI